jgi:hypothetical protein
MHEMAMRPLKEGTYLATGTQLQMGIYIDRGLEYWVECTDGEPVRIVSTKEADDRLVTSEYYLSRESRWFSGQHRSSSSTFLGDLADMTLTTQETERLQHVLQTHKGRVARHGWYDVVYLQSTL